MSIFVSYYNTNNNDVTHSVSCERVLTFTETLGFGLPAPALLVRIGAPLVLRTDPELAIYGRYVVPARLLREGFAFRYGDLASALTSLYR